MARQGSSPRPFTCCYCGLPVRLFGDRRHPGYGIVDDVECAEPRDDGLPSLGVLHRFCGQAARSRPPACGRVLRRAWLGWVTEQFDAGARTRRFGLRHYDRLGLHPARLASPRLYRRYWRIAKMRCAARAWDYYAK